MQDPFTGRETCLQGSTLPGARQRHDLQDHHRSRLEAFDRLGACAAECRFTTDPDRDLTTVPGDAVELLELAGPSWAAFGDANRAWRELVPLLPLEKFGFPPESDNPLEEPNPHLVKVGGGVEAWAFQSADRSIYKFYRPAEDTSKTIGSIFGFRSGDETEFVAEAKTGSYRQLFEKLLVIAVLDGMPTEVIAVTPEGIVVVKQTWGEPLPQGDDVSKRLPGGLIEIPSRFLRANRDHPRLLFVDDRPFLVADLHSRNLVRAADSVLRAIDLVHVEWAAAVYARSPLLAAWLERVRLDPTAGALPTAADDEL